MTLECQKNGGFLSKPLDSGKTFLIVPLVLIGLASDLKADTLEK